MASRLMNPTAASLAAQKAVEAQRRELEAKGLSRPPALHFGARSGANLVTKSTSPQPPLGSRHSIAAKATASGSRTEFGPASADTSRNPSPVPRPPKPAEPKVALRLFAPQSQSTASAKQSNKRSDDAPRKCDETELLSLVDRAPAQSRLSTGRVSVVVSSESESDDLPPADAEKASPAPQISETAGEQRFFDCQSQPGDPPAPEQVPEATTNPHAGHENAPAVGNTPPGAKWPKFAWTETSEHAVSVQWSPARNPSSAPNSLAPAPGEHRSDHPGEHPPQGHRQPLIGRDEEPHRESPQHDPAVPEPFGIEGKGSFPVPSPDRKQKTPRQRSRSRERDRLEPPPLDPYEYEDCFERVRKRPRATDLTVWMAVWERVCKEAVTPHPKKRTAKKSTGRRTKGSSRQSGRPSERSPIAALPLDLSNVSQTQERRQHGSRTSVRTQPAADKVRQTRSSQTQAKAKKKSKAPAKKKKVPHRAKQSAVRQKPKAQ